VFCHRLVGNTDIADLFQGGFVGSSKWFHSGRNPLNHRRAAWDWVPWSASGFSSLFSGLGAPPSSISYRELYSALQTHIVEDQENPLAQVSTGKLYEVQKYCALSNHCWSGYWIVANRRALASLPADLVEILNSNLDAAAIRERADLLDMDRSLQAELTVPAVPPLSSRRCRD
jgi:Bacterial extracellular solute-binding protein, family 7